VSRGQENLLQIWLIVAQLVKKFLRFPESENPLPGFKPPAIRSNPEPFKSDPSIHILLLY
jgi:hypothetical protein